MGPYTGLWIRRRGEKTRTTEAAITGTGGKRGGTERKTIYRWKQKRRTS